MNDTSSTSKRPAGDAVITTVRLPADLARVVRERAEVEGRAQGAVIRRAVAAGLGQKVGR